MVKNDSTEWQTEKATLGGKAKHLLETSLLGDYEFLVGLDNDKKVAGLLSQPENRLQISA